MYSATTDSTYLIFPIWLFFKFSSNTTGNFPNAPVPSSVRLLFSKYKYCSVDSTARLSRGTIVIPFEFKFRCRTVSSPLKLSPFKLFSNLFSRKSSSSRAFIDGHVRAGISLMLLFCRSNTFNDNGMVKIFSRWLCSTFSVRKLINLVNAPRAMSFKRLWLRSISSSVGNVPNVGFFIVSKSL